ncbi:unnamed protein product [Aureobasidium vineae]|uniref:Uncharacterized protein n=1 Tax=Aureobasidium vineae TaxID=2773715 RepID=A0A9N8JEQ3_9PEZI|nr:unnamed protein product [Aureobasidium vineae]
MSPSQTSARQPQAKTACPAHTGRGCAAAAPTDDTTPIETSRFACLRRAESPFDQQRIDLKLTMINEKIAFASELVKRFGPQMVSSTPIEITLTVPAIWSDTAKDTTFRVAQKAGMGSNLRMISEPEAAAIYALTVMAEDSNVLQVGDNFIVCDAGGGPLIWLHSKFAPNHL